MNQQFVLDLSKTFELNLTKAGVAKIPVLRTRAAIDRSGSMAHNFDQGFVQRAVDLFIAAALKFDDNGELEIGFFNHSFTETEVAVLADAGRYMRTKGGEIDARGGTEFAPVIDWTLEEDTRGQAPQQEEAKGFFGKLKSALVGSPKTEAAAGAVALPDCGQYLGIVTDGKLESHASMQRFEHALSNVDQFETFIQFIGIGDGVDTAYLNRVANAYVNVSFVHITNPLKFDDNSFYEQLSNAKFVSWIEQYNKARGVQ